MSSLGWVTVDIGLLDVPFRKWTHITHAVSHSLSSAPSAFEMIPTKGTGKRAYRMAR